MAGSGTISSRNSKRERQDTEVLPSVQEQDGAREHHDDRNPREEQLGAEPADDDERQGGADEQQTDTDGLGARPPKSLALTPREPCGERNDQETVRVVLVVGPVVHELA